MFISFIPNFDIGNVRVYSISEKQQYSCIHIPLCFKSVNCSRFTLCQTNDPPVMSTNIQDYSLKVHFFCPLKFELVNISVFSSIVMLFVSGFGAYSQVSLIQVDGFNDSNFSLK